MISVVVPVYNSENSLTELTERIYSTLSEKHDFELLYIDDGSKDSSWETIEKLVATYPKIRGFKLGRNFGQHNALLCGIRQAKGSTIVTLDDDLQHSPEDIPLLLDKLSKGFDVVYGTPVESVHGYNRGLVSKLTKFALEKSMNAKIALKISAFRVFKTDLRKSFKSFSGSNINIDVLLSWATKNFGSIQVTHQTRKYGQSGYSTIKLIKHALNMLTGFTTRPLKLAILGGFFFSFFGLSIFLYVSVSWLFVGSSVPGFPFLASIIAIFSGVQLIAIGIIGEYLAKVHVKVSDQPSYVINSTCKGKKVN
jgi:glycosyltransferase involved in cell wall biosynthesis